MEIFSLSLQQMLMMFALIIAGFVLKKAKALPENAHITISRLTTHIITPAITLSSMMNNCTLESFRTDYKLIICGGALAIAVLLASYPLSRIFVRKPSSSPERTYQSNVYKYALTVANYGFMGNFLIREVWGDAMLYKYMLFTCVSSVIVNSWGLFMLIPKDESKSKWENLKKGLLTPPLIAVVSGLFLGLTGIAKYIPDFLLSAVDNAGRCQGPVGMVLTGFVIGSYSLKKIIGNGKVYLASAFRLVIIPAALILALKAIGITTFSGFENEVLILTLVLFATPFGLNTIIFPAAYGGETKTGASMALISSVLCLITIPLMYLVFIG